MAALPSCVQTTGSFQEVFETCYSHGLETIYKLENVDLKTVRKLAEVKAKPSFKIFLEELSDPQLEFDFGPFYRGWQVPFVLQEPIQLLKLSKPIEKNLNSHGFKTLYDLKHADLQALRLGQGHIEEIRSKLKSYLSDKPLEKTTTIDFLSLIKCFFGAEDPCKAYVALEPYGLHEWIFLAPSETVLIKRSSIDLKDKWEKEILSNISIGHHFQTLIDTWAYPWIQKRGGIASQEELIEYLILQSSDPFLAKKALELILKIANPFESMHSFNGCFVFSEESFQKYKAIYSIAKSYFINKTLEIPLVNLINFVIRELLSIDIQSTQEDVERGLRLFSKFDLFRNQTGIWNVRCIYS